MAGELPALHDTGDGPALLFLHAFPLDSSQWDHQTAALSGRFRCVRPDFWGCASSPAPPDHTPSLDAFAARLLDALDERGIDRFDAVGVSMGGYLAFSLLRTALARVRSVVLANTRASADSEAARDDRLKLADQVLAASSVEGIVEPNVNRLLGSVARAEVHVTDPLRGRIRRWTPEGVAFAARAMASRPDSTALLASLRLPALVIAGDDDAVISGDEIRGMSSALRGSQLVTMTCGHLSNLEQPHVFTEHVRRFLSTLPEQST
jgi:pimeloyl-ACP methyl ester carboxylesterase